MPRQIDAGKKYLLSNDTASKLVRLLGVNKGVATDIVNTDSNIVAGTNLTGTDIEPFNVVLLYDSAFEEDQDEFADEEVFEITLPSQSETRIGITLDNIPSFEAETGPVAIGGTCPVYCDILDVSHTHAVVASNSRLESATSGPLRILKQSFSGETGEQLVKVKFETPLVGSGMVHGTLQSDITADNLTVDVAVIFSLLQDVRVGDIVTTQNFVGYSGSLGGDAIVWYHGDGTGNEDGTYTLMGARCPE